MDATIRLPADSIDLDGTVTDDGLPTGSAVSTVWTVQSGPAGATFGDPNTVDTTVTFASEGTYVLLLTADDTALQGTDTVEVIVEAVPALAVVTVAPANTTLAAGGTEAFTASGADQYGDPIAVDVTWTATGGTIDAAGNYTAGIVPGSYVVTATDGTVVGNADVTISTSPPTADAGGPYVGVEGASIVLDGSASTDPNNDITDYDWDLDNDGVYNDATGVSPTFAAGSSGTYTIGLQVTDSDGAMNTDTATVTVSNVVPVAEAGGPYSGGQGVDIPLNGSASADPGNDIVSYEWDLDNDGSYETPGVSAFFNSATSGSFTVGLRVTDDDGASDTDTASVTVSSDAPIANAGGPYSGDQGADIALDASASSDPSGIASYEWDLDNDTVYETTGVNATFSSADAGVFTVGLRVTDNDGDTATTTVDVTVNDLAPVADAGGPYSGDQGADIALDGSASSDPSGIATYQWDLDNDTVYETAGVNATFSSADAGVFTVGLRVTDNDGTSGTTTVDVTVNDLAPVADAGGPYTGDQGADIALDASGSSDPSGIATYEWDLDDDTVYETAGVNATFNSTTAGVFIVNLRVTDNDGSSSVTLVGVTVNGLPPVADAGGPYSGNQGTTIVLDASASSDPSGIATYEWDLDNDTVYETAGVSPSYAPPLAGVFTVGLRVTDNDGDSATTTVDVTVNDLAPVADAGGPYSGGQDEDIALDGSASSDPSGIATYEWDLDNDTVYETPGVNATFSSPTPGVFTVGLQVTDNDGSSATTTVDVTVNDSAPAAPTGLGASAQNGQVILDWDDNTEPDIAGYTVLRSETQGGPYTSVSGLLVNSDFIDSTVVNDTAYYYVVTAQDGIPNVSSNSAEVTVTPALVHAYWKLDEDVGTTIADSVLPDDGSGTINGPATWVPGVDGSALDLNGTPQHVVIDNTASLDIRGTEISLQAWLFPQSGGGSEGSRIISKQSDDLASEVYAMALDEYRFRFILDGQEMVSSHVAVLNEWVHVAMVYDGTDMRIYINGQLDAATPVAKSDPIDSSSRAVHLGKLDVDGNGRYYNGIIDEVEIYNSAVTPGAKSPPPRAPAGIYYEDITEDANLQNPDFGGHGVMFAEVDNDSDPDLYLTINKENFGDQPDYFFDNTNGAQFAEVAAARGIQDSDGGSFGAVWADLDNDGDYDLVNGTSWDNGTPSTGNPENDNIFRNDGIASGSFTEVTATSPQFAAFEIETRGITAFDMDSDGDLDIFGVPGLLATVGVNSAFLNNGGLVFTSHTGGALSTAPAVEGITDTDFDGDGDIDILAASGPPGQFVILENLTAAPDSNPGVFAQVSPSSLGIIDDADHGITTGDVDNDGDLDLVLADGTRGYLYHRLNNGTYTKVQTFNDVEGFMGGLADLDNDTHLDLVFAGDEKIYIGGPSGTFGEDQSVPVSAIQQPFAVAFADIDSDGDVDFAIAAGESRNLLVRNDLNGAGGGWLKVELVSPQCQAGAFGAKVKIFDGATLVGMREAKGSSGYLAQDDPVLHFGLDTIASVDVVVDWVDGTQTTSPAVTADQRILIDACPP